MERTTAPREIRIPRPRERRVRTKRFLNRKRFLQAIVRIPPEYPHVFSGSDFFGFLPAPFFFLLRIPVFSGYFSFWPVYFTASTGDIFTTRFMAQRELSRVTSPPKTTARTRIQGRKAIIAEASPLPCRYIPVRSRGITVTVIRIPAAPPTTQPPARILPVWRRTIDLNCLLVVPMVFSSPYCRISRLREMYMTL